MSISFTGTDQARALRDAELAQQVAGMRSRGYEELRGLRNVDARGLVADEAGRLWLRSFADPATGRPRVPDEHAFVVADDGVPVWFRRPDQPWPRTLDEYRAEQERVRAAQARVLAERDAAIEKMSKEAARVVSFGDFDRLAPATLADAAERVRLAGGRLDIVDDRLYVVLPAAASRSVAAASQMLYAAEAAVIAALRAGKPVPAVEVTPAGAPIAKPKGRS